MKALLLIYSAIWLVVIAVFVYRSLVPVGPLAPSAVPVLLRGELQTVEKTLLTRTAPTVASPSATVLYGKTEPFSK